MLQKVGELSGGAVQIPSFPMDHHNVTGVMHVLDIQKTNILAEQMPKGGRLGSDGDAGVGVDQLPPEQMTVVLGDLYSRGATIVSNNDGYGIYFRKEDTLYFVELMAENDRAAEILMEAAREKEVIVEKAVITVGAAQNLFLGEGTRQDYGMIRFEGEPFDVSESYMRLMLD